MGKWRGLFPVTFQLRIFQIIPIPTIVMPLSVAQLLCSNGCSRCGQNEAVFKTALGFLGDKRPSYGKCFNPVCKIAVEEISLEPGYNMWLKRTVCVCACVCVRACVCVCVRTCVRV